VRSLVLLAIPLAVAACGSTARPSSGPRVTVSLTAPGDAKSVRAESVRVQGTVTPTGASVEVNGEAASVSGGTFTAEVSLDPGQNVIDVTASAPGRRPDADAVRVTRDIRVEIPDLVGQSSDDAKSRLSGLGLDVKEEHAGNFLDRFFGDPEQVCELRPGAGELVDPGATVTLTLAPNCSG
jgi:glucodextranase-like protein/PASTA domain-containing protein